jgi:hypothetical protein
LSRTLDPFVDRPPLVFFGGEIVLTVLTAAAGLAAIALVAVTAPTGWPSLALPLVALLVLGLLNIALNARYPAKSAAKKALRRALILMLPSAVLVAIFLPLVITLDAALFATAPFIVIAFFFRRPLTSQPVSRGWAATSLVLLAAVMFATPWTVGGGPLFLAVYCWSLCLVYVAVLASRHNLRATVVLAGLAGALSVAATTISQWVAAGSAPAGPAIVVSAVFLIMMMGAAAALLMVLACLIAGILELAGMVRSRRPAYLDRQIELGPHAKAATGSLARDLARNNAYVVRQSGDALRQAELDPQKSLPVLVEALHDRDIQIRYSSAKVLAEMGAAAAPAASSLARLVGGDPMPGDRAADALARIGASGVAPLVDLLAAGGEPQRIAAAAGLRLAGDQQAPLAVPALVAALADASASVRRHAVASLGELGAAASSAQEAIRARLEDGDLLVRLAARKALMRLSAAEVAS